MYEPCFALSPVQKGTSEACVFNEIKQMHMKNLNVLRSNYEKSRDTSAS